MSQRAEHKKNRNQIQLLFKIKLANEYIVLKEIQIDVMPLKNTFR